MYTRIAIEFFNTPAVSITCRTICISSTRSCFNCPTIPVWLTFVIIFFTIFSAVNVASFISIPSISVVPEILFINLNIPTNPDPASPTSLLLNSSPRVRYAINRKNDIRISRSILTFPLLTFAILIVSTKLSILPFINTPIHANKESIQFVLNSGTELEKYTLFTNGNTSRLILADTNAAENSLLLPTKYSLFFNSSVFGFIYATYTQSASRFVLVRKCKIVSNISNVLSNNSTNLFCAVTPVLSPPPPPPPPATSVPSAFLVIPLLTHCSYIVKTFEINSKSRGIPCLIQNGNSIDACINVRDLSCSSTILNPGLSTTCINALTIPSNTTSGIVDTNASHTPEIDLTVLVPTQLNGICRDPSSFNVVSHPFFSKNNSSANSFPSLPNLSSLFNIAIIFSIISSFTLGKCRINSSIPTPKVPGMSPSCSIFTKLKSVNTPNITSSILDSENIFSPALFKQIAPNPFGIAINTSPEYGICSSIDFKNVCGSLDS
ncbi:hypothetical protein AX774_g5080 [Zancudomyces culisetae]|uniref:Transmembrane protein n=1 Tax=Zancudomyces culisetae TaxID=1213189 RepID=A0A1R1PKK7_ZANCU|nr:hypothetical protein AX774_g5080 [Zancudomyces culisetae]|eukprot:OMH81463.1 hypothetical protein AX774_g5080 [Zancudomyces culisetae]